MIITIAQLKNKYQSLGDKNGKIARDVKQGKLFPLVKGLYETDPNADGAKLAQFIYGPSYVSFDYVLYKNGFIPEAVYKTYTCATFNKKKIKTYTNHFGTFVYRDVPKDVFPMGIQVYQEGEYTFWVATSEKALCDKLYALPPVRTIKAFRTLLFVDLRLDETEFARLNKEDLLELAPLYHATNLQWLTKLIKGE